MSKMNRRQFCEWGAIGGLSMTLGSGAHDAQAQDAQAQESRARSASAQTTMPIVDTHQHLWDLTKFRLNWLEGAPEILRRSYLTADYLEATKGLQVAKAVYMEVDLAVDQQVDEAEHVVGLCQSAEHPTAGAVISGRPGSPEFKNYIQRFAGNKFIKGVRQVLHSDETPSGLCLEAEFVRSIQLLGELGKSYDICIRPTELGDAVQLVDRCPETRFIIDHCGNADPKAFLADPSEEPWHDADDWRQGMAKLADRRNTICKISGIVARVPKAGWGPETLAPIVNHCLDVFGADRVVFGGDWPVCLLGASYASWVGALKEIVSERPKPDQQNLLHDNAERLYGLG